MGAPLEEGAGELMPPTQCWPQGREDVGGVGAGPGRGQEPLSRGPPEGGG